MAELERKTLLHDWYKNSRFWQVFAPLMFGPERWEQTPSEVTAIIDLLELKGTERILDACCGVGRHSLEFARRGFSVTGVDLTEDFIRAAEESATAEGLSVTFVVEDIREYYPLHSYEVILNLYTSFGYFESEEEDLRFLKRMKDCLTPGGVLLIETKGKEITARDFKESEWYEEAGMYVLAHYEIEEDWTLLKNRWILITEDSRCDYTFSQRLYSAREGKRLLEEAGFTEVSIFGNLQKAPYDAKAETLVFLARTPH
ncbi:MAG: class I SAM-dependent methyltransferase [Spirochaetes bacterium]|nr:class I SAM-dependent methyltransferase [Spirochaetota bacterium]